MVIGIYLSAAIGMLWYLRRVDWDNEARNAVKRLSTIEQSMRRIDTGVSPTDEGEEEEETIR